MKTQKQAFAFFRREMASARRAGGARHTRAVEQVQLRIIGLRHIKIGF